MTKSSCSSIVIILKTLQNVLKAVNSTEGAYWYLQDVISRDSMTSSLIDLTSQADIHINTAVNTLLHSQEKIVLKFMGNIPVDTIDISLINTFDEYRTSRAVLSR